MKIEHFDGQACRTLRASMQRALDRLDLDGVTIKVGSITYHPNTATIKVTAETEGADEKRSDALEHAMSMHRVSSKEADG